MCRTSVIFIMKKAKKISVYESVWKNYNKKWSYHNISKRFSNNMDWSKYKSIDMLIFDNLILISERVHLYPLRVITSKGTQAGFCMGCEFYFRPLHLNVMQFLGMQYQRLVFLGGKITIRAFLVKILPGRVWFSSQFVLFRRTFD